ncbi:hypothetical protein O181_010282 [Austropuccinia psidii MF-1]|uniref:Reverse transcriptase Ty1/copia-type domain-containing protein n=1 Tax=Austropuccinia psidii MF-1 TaxID=1389203 RepID=A0A9Q3BTE5_9BASI|nr:hypothetical protein [Austropuccinia psidii MF-1]
MLDPTLVEEINGQDESVEFLSSEASNKSEAPNNYKEAMASEAKNEWKAAMASELQSLEDMEVWSEVLEVQANQVLRTRWVFSVKRDPTGNIVKYKARGVVQGHRQIWGLNLDETFAPMPTFTSPQFLLAIASGNVWDVQTFDVTTAYLCSLLEEDVFVKAPPGTSASQGKVFKLERALYGLKQAGRFWWKHMKEILEKAGSQETQEDQSTYTYKQGSNRAFLWMHVDDGVIMASSASSMTELKDVLSSELNLRKLCSLSPSNITAGQSLPIMDLASEKATKIDKAYLSHIGMLLYVAQATWPDIIFSVNYLARFSMNTTSKHWAASEHLISYMRGTMNKALVLDLEGREEHWRYMWMQTGEVKVQDHSMGSPGAWNSKRQTCVASSTCQA